MVRGLKRQFSKLYGVYVTNIKALIRCAVTAPYMQYTGFLDKQYYNVLCDLLMYSRHAKGGGEGLFQWHVCIKFYIRSYLPGARYMYLNFLRVDSKDGDQTGAKFCCSSNETVY